MSSGEKKLSKTTIYRWIAIAVAVVVIAVCAIRLVDNLGDINRLKTQTDEAEKKYNQQIEDNDSLKAVVDSDDKDSYIEEEARKKGYAKEGETVFYDASADK